MIDAHLTGKAIQTSDIAQLLIGGQSGVDGIRFCLAPVIGGEDMTSLSWSWFLVFKNINGEGETVALTPVYENDLVKLPWVPGATATQVPGKLEIQIYATQSSGEDIIKKWVSERKVLYIQEAVNPTQIIPTTPTILEQYLTSFTSLKDEAETHSLDAQAAQAAAENARDNIEQESRELTKIAELDASNKLVRNLQGDVPVYAVGDTGPAGGVIFHIDGDTVYESAPPDAEIIWGSDYSFVPFSEIGETNNNGTAIGSGRENSQNAYDSGLINLERSAVEYVHRLVYGGYADWFIPSRDELLELYNVLKEGSLQDFEADRYWSSSQTTESNEISMYFNGENAGTILATAKSSGINVRPIRSFKAMSIKKNADTIATKVKFTKMPDGTTAVYSQDAWATVDGWIAGSGGALDITTTPGVCRITATASSGGYMSKTLGSSSKQLVIRYKNSPTSTGFRVFDGTGLILDKNFVASMEWAVAKIQIPANLTAAIYIGQISGYSAGSYVEIDSIWVGDYAYSENSLATEASRIANQLGDTTGVGTKASGFVKSGSVNPEPSSGDTVTIAGITYTYVNTFTGGEHEIKIDEGNNNWLYLSYCISTGDTVKSRGPAHPLVSAKYRSGGIVEITAIKTGVIGNTYELKTSVPETFILSGSVLVGGIDDVGEKLRTQIASLSGQWITPTLVNGATGTFKYRKNLLGQVEFQAVVTIGTAILGTTILTLPAGYTPSLGMYLVSCFDGNDGLAYNIRIRDSGIVVLMNGFNTGRTYHFVGVFSTS